jgi:hypothetical protein
MKLVTGVQFSGEDRAGAIRHRRGGSGIETERVRKNLNTFEAKSRLFPSNFV